jgi:hypothetical protein
MKPQLPTVLLAASMLTCDRTPASRAPSGDAPSAEHVRWIQVDTDAAGRIAKCAVYHNDPDVVPNAVRQLAERKFPESKSRFFETELYPDHGLVYEVEVETREGKHCEIAGKPDGTELYTECGLDHDDVPRAVLEASKKLLPQGELEEAEAKRGPKVDEIDLEVRVGTELHYLRYTTDGALLDHLVRMRGAVRPETGDPPLGG